MTEQFSFFQLAVKSQKCTSFRSLKKHAKCDPNGIKIVFFKKLQKFSKIAHSFRRLGTPPLDCDTFVGTPGTRGWEPRL